MAAFRFPFFLFLILQPLILSAEEPQLQPVSAVAAVSVTLTGQVKRLGTRDVIADAQILNESGSDVLASSGLDGKFLVAFSFLTPTVKVAAAGHAARKVKLDFSKSLVLEKTVYLKPVDFIGQEVVVRGRKEREQISQVTLKTREIKRIPGTGGDALRAIQNLPGVVSPSDYSGALVVRGGGPNDNLYMLDNVPWPTPYHFGGIVSTVNPNLLTEVDLYAGGFPARWGDAQGAVLDCRSRAGKKDGIHGSGEVSLLMANGLLEGPLGVGDASITISGRRSYYDLIIPRVMDTSQLTVFPRFWDLGGTLDFSTDPHNKVRVLGLASDDLMAAVLKPEDTNYKDFAGEFRMESGFFTSGLTWTNTSQEDFTSVVTPFCYRTYEQESFGQGYNVTFNILAYGLKDENTWEAGKLLGMDHELGFGGLAGKGEYEAWGFMFKRSSSTPGGSSTTLYEAGALTVTGQAFQVGAYLQDRVGFYPGWWLTLGGRYDRHSMALRDTTTPRLGLEWHYDERTQWKLAWGDYDQFPAGQYMSRDYGNPNLFAQRCEHAVLELEKKFAPGLTGKLAGYYKTYTGIVESVPPPDPLPYENLGAGDARGLEVFLKEDLGEKFFAWASYAWSVSERLQDAQSDWRLYQYDQTHVATLVGSYSLRPQWSVGVKFHYNTGPLITPVTGTVPDPDPNNNSHVQPVYGRPYSQRLADYARLDLRTDYTWLYEGWKLGVFFEIINALGRDNPLQEVYNKDYSQRSTFNNLGRFPNFGLEAEF